MFMTEWAREVVIPFMETLSAVGLPITSFYSETSHYAE